MIEDPLYIHVSSVYQICVMTSRFGSKGVCIGLLYAFLDANRLSIIVYRAVSYSNKGVSVLDIIIAEHESLHCVLHRYMQSTSFELALLALLLLASFRNSRFRIRPICPL
jgi:hypothetical protein